MLHKLLLAGIALGLGVSAAPAQYPPDPGSAPPPVLPPPTVQTPPSQTGYWVQFRQPYWRETTFNSQIEMDNYIQQQRRLGPWELQVLPSPVGVYRLRYRMTQWGSSNILRTLAEAQRWAAYLEDLGYEPRIRPWPVSG